MGKTFWMIVFASQPAFLLLGMLGMLGDDAEEAANEMATIYAIVFAIVFVIAVIYLLLKAAGIA